MDGKVVVVTGSSRGIGAATARLAHKRGATVVVHGKTDSTQLQTVAKELSAFKIVCDVTDQKAVQDAIKEAVDEHGQIDVLVNSAGVATGYPFLEMTDEHWRKNFDANVLGSANFCQAVIPHMKKTGSGSIVNVASIKGIGAMTSDRSPSYSVSKAGVIALTTSLAKQFAPDIRINAVSPGYTHTDMAKGWTESRWKQAESALLGRVGQPEEIAKALLFLASDEASFITGRNLVVDGGYELAGK